eukprot:6693406-Prymnesium_polylepis.1
MRSSAASKYSSQTMARPRNMYSTTSRSNITAGALPSSPLNTHAPLPCSHQISQYCDEAFVSSSSQPLPVSSRLPSGGPHEPGAASKVDVWASRRPSIDALAADSAVLPPKISSAAEPSTTAAVVPK